MIYAIIFALLVLFELGYFRVADRFNIIDKPNMRSSHVAVTLRGGGIIFLFGAWIYAAFFGSDNGWFLLGLTLIGLVSFIDDIHSLPDFARLPVQFVAMFLMFHQFGILNWYDWWRVLIALIVCVGITNAYNFMDGINGITGGYSLVVLSFLAHVNRYETAFVDAGFLHVVIISALVFCFFNFRKRARCFAGDVGSVSMAYIVLFALGSLILKTGDLSYLIALAVYGVDTVLTIVHRLMLGENIFEAHRKHAYQLMANELGMPHVLVSLFYMLLQGALCTLFIAADHHWLVFGVSVVVLALLYVAFMKRYFHLHQGAR